MTTSKREVSGIGLFSAAGQVLLHLRDDNPRIHQPGRWALIGGHIEPGESPHEALVREVQEEIGMKLTHFELLIRVPAGGTTYHLHYGILDSDAALLDVYEGQKIQLFDVQSALELESLTDLARLFLRTYAAVNELRTQRGYAPLLSDGLNR